MKSYLILLLGIILSSSCGQTYPPSLDHEIPLPAVAFDIEVPRGSLDVKFLEAYLLVGGFVFRDVPIELRKMTDFFIPGDVERKLEPGIRFGSFVTSLSTIYNLPIINWPEDQSPACRKIKINFVDRDGDMAPGDFHLSQRCGIDARVESESDFRLKEMALNVSVSDEDDADPSSGFSQKIDFKNVFVNGRRYEGHFLRYAFPSASGYSTAVTEDLTVKRLADLHYSIALDRRRKAETAEGRKSGVALKMNMIADPERFENFEKIRDPKSPDSSDMIIRKFSDVRAKGKFQIVDGFIQFVVDSDVRTFKISSTPLVYENPYVLNGKKSIPDQSYYCSGEAFSSGTITMTDVAGNKLELRYSRNPLNLPKEQGPGNCLLKYYLNDQELKTSPNRSR